MKTEFLIPVLVSLPLVTSIKKLCKSWITSALQPFGFLTNISKHDMFGRESGEIIISHKIEVVIRDERNYNNNK